MISLYWILHMLSNTYRSLGHLISPPTPLALSRSVFPHYTLPYLTDIFSFVHRPCGMLYGNPVFREQFFNGKWQMDARKWLCIVLWPVSVNCWCLLMTSTWYWLSFCVFLCCFRSQCHDAHRKQETGSEPKQWHLWFYCEKQSETVSLKIFSPPDPLLTHTFPSFPLQLVLKILPTLRSNACSHWAAPGSNFILNSRVSDLHTSPDS